jgi:hypothetical protein
MTDADEHDDLVKDVFWALIKRGGGKDNHDAAQIEIAAAVANILCDIRTADPDDKRKLSGTLSALLPLLPELSSKKPTIQLPEITASTSLSEAAQIYNATLQGNLSEADIARVVERLERARSAGKPVTGATIKEQFYAVAIGDDGEPEPEIIDAVDVDDSKAIADAQDTPLARETEESHDDESLPGGPPGVPSPQSPWRPPPNLTPWHSPPEPQPSTGTAAAT